MSHIVLSRQGSSIILYVVQDRSPLTDDEISNTAAELWNAIDTETNTLMIGGVPVPITGNPVLIMDTDAGNQQQSKLPFCLLLTFSSFPFK